MPHSEEICAEKFVCFCSGSIELQMHENSIFFTPVKYTLFCHAPLVSWAAQHTTVCFDNKRSIWMQLTDVKRTRREEQPFPVE